MVLNLYSEKSCRVSGVTIYSYPAAVSIIRMSRLLYTIKADIDREIGEPIMDGYSS